MAKSKSQKTTDLGELTDKVKAAKSIVFTEYRGTTVKDITKFRAALRKENVFSKVYKLTLVKKALAEAGVSGQVSDYKTPVILSLSEEDETSPARAIKSLAKEIKTIKILEGVVDKAVIAKSQVEALADLPSKDQLRAQLVGTINAPVSGFVNVLAANLRGLVNVLNAIATK
ncbi:MAG: 50S ribosomal protein L10 [Candidatus Doudnabacteria bacterium]|nr:50S ribosomal protein L10 [Candidatus Doudnabacteria bacterium]